MIAFFWQLFVPVIVVFIMKKIMSMLKMGNLFSPTEALSMATGGAGRITGDGGAASAAVTAGIAAPGNTKNAALDRANKAASWWQKDTLGKKAILGAGRGTRKAAEKLGDGAEATARALESGAEHGAAALGLLGEERKQELKAAAEEAKAAKALAKDSRENPQHRAEPLPLGERMKGLGAATGSALKGNYVDPLVSAGSKLGAAWKNGRAEGGSGALAVGRAALDMAAPVTGEVRDAAGHAAGLLAAAGIKMVGSDRQALTKVLTTAGQWANPGAAALEARQNSREARALAAGKVNPDERAAAIGEHWSGRLLEVAKAPALRGELPSGPLDVRSAAAIRHQIAENLGIDPSIVGLEAVTGVHTYLPSTRTKIPNGGSAAANWEIAGDAVHYLPNEFKQKGPDESDFAFQARMTATKMVLGALKSDGTQVNWLERSGVKDTSENRVEVMKAAAGKPSALDKIQIDLSEQMKNDIQATTRVLCAQYDSTGGAAAQMHNVLDADLGKAEAAGKQVKELLSSTGSRWQQQIQTAVQGAASHSQVTEDMVAFVERELQPLLTQAADVRVRAATVNAIAGLDVNKIDAHLAKATAAEDAVKAELEAVIKGVNKKLVQLQSASTDQFSTVLTDLQKEVDSALTKQARKVEDQVVDARASLMYELKKHVETFAKTNPPPATGLPFSGGASPAPLTSA